MYCRCCGKDLNPVAAMMGSVCGDCVGKQHKRVVDGKSGLPERLQKGDRVTWTKRGETLMGTVRYDVHPEDDTVAVNCDAIRTVAGGVPVGRIEHPRVEDVRKLENT